MRKIVLLLFLGANMLAIRASVLGALDNPRSAAMGGSYVVFANNVYAYANQASLGYSDRSVLSLSYQNRFLVQELSLVSMRFSTPLQRLNVGISSSFFGFSQYNEFSVGVHVSRVLSPSFSVGAQVDYVSVLLSPDEGSVGAFVPQLGMIMKATPSIVLGVHLYNLTLSNLQTAYNTEYLHSSITAGIEYVVDKNLLLVGQLSKPLRSDAIVSAGIEYAVVPDLQLRAGFRAQEQVEPSFGLGLKIDVLQFDLSMQYHSLLGVLISSGVSYSFRK
ncbi:MAG: hypothetical protein KA397_01145 [Paludibacteraceae bacterium]|nr:hypothetical protein [Paludibacteraceae bacterium]MBP6284260.1 hypothetical protein [Paludibacteraceae bacterium]